MHLNFYVLIPKTLGYIPKRLCRIPKTLGYTPKFLPYNG